MKITHLARLGLLTLSATLVLSPAVVSAQAVVIDPTAIAKMGEQYTQQLKQIAIEQAKLAAANETMNFIKRQASGLTPQQWRQYQGVFKTITTAPSFISTSTEQQKVQLDKFNKYFPDWGQSTSFATYATRLTDATKNAAQGLLDAASSSNEDFKSDKVTLDTLSNYEPKTNAERLNVMSLLLRQSVEQMQKERALATTQASSMGVYYGTIAADRQKSNAKTCESQIASILSVAHTYNSNVTEQMVRDSYYKDHPDCNAAK